MNIFYAPQIPDKQYYLDEGESRHCAKVLRKKPGDEIHLVDGQGGFYLADLVKIDPKQCSFRINKVIEEYKKRSFHVHIAIAPTKNIDRFEWFLEKSAEIGIDEITPLVCARSERKKIKTDRLDKILISAMKQSGNAYLPQLNDPEKFENFMDRISTNTENYQYFIGYCGNEIESESLKNCYVKGKNVIVLIGPEGDFLFEEVEKALKKGFKSVNLGNNRLRTETAGVVACHTINLINQ